MGLLVAIRHNRFLKTAYGIQKLMLPSASGEAGMRRWHVNMLSTKEK
jgi:hypothetical protein